MLFWKECKKVICSLTFLLYVVVVVVMYATQFAGHLKEPIERPKVGAEWYGSKELEIPEVIMAGATESLVEEYVRGHYDTYPHMFYKQVKLKESDSVKIAAIIEELTGLTVAEMKQFDKYEPGGYYASLDENGKQVLYYRSPVLPEYELSETVSYERFKELMCEAEEIIGKGSSYEEKKLLRDFGNVEMTYEDAVAEYEEVMEGGNLAKSYLRLFSDYAGIDLAILPVFVCVTMWQLDKRSRMEPLIYSRKRSSLSLVLTRYLALVCCMAVPVLLTLLHTVISMAGLYPEQALSFGGAVGDTLLWLLPNITIVTALGAFLSELVSPLIAIFVQGAWWYLALESTELVGDITKFALVLRHNSMASVRIFEAQYADFVWNRWFYIIVSLALVLLTVGLYEWKRRGNKIVPDGKKQWKLRRREA